MTSVATKSSASTAEPKYSFLVASGAANFKTYVFDSKGEMVPETSREGHPVEYEGGSDAKPTATSLELILRETGDILPADRSLYNLATLQWLRRTSKGKTLITKGITPKKVASQVTHANAIETVLRKAGYDPGVIWTVTGVIGNGKSGRQSEKWVNLTFFNNPADYETVYDEIKRLGKP